MWFAGGLLLAGIAGVLAFMTLLRASSAPQATAPVPTVQVLVATRDLPLHTVLGAADVALRDVSPEAVPQGALTDPEQAVGQMLVADVAADEILLSRRMLKPDYLGPKVGLVMDPTKVVIAFPINDLLCSLDLLRPGDRIDMMFTFAAAAFVAGQGEGKGLTTMTVMPDVEIAGIVRGGGEGQEGGALRALLLAFDPQDALLIKFFRDNGATVDMALRSPAAAEGPFDTVPVDGDYVVQRFRLQGVLR